MQVDHIGLTPCVESARFQRFNNLETTSISSRWFQMPTCTPTARSVDLVGIDPNDSMAVFAGTNAAEAAAGARSPDHAQREVSLRSVHGEGGANNDPGLKAPLVSKSLNLMKVKPALLST